MSWGLYPLQKLLSFNSISVAARSPVLDPIVLIISQITGYKPDQETNQVKSQKSKVKSQNYKTSVFCLLLVASFSEGRRQDTDS